MFRALLLALASLTAVAQTGSDAPRYDGDGKLMLPENYREWIYLSSGLGMTYGPAASADAAHPLFDNVFVSPAAYRVFVNSGHWPDKTVFILEIRRSNEKGSINNGGHFQSDVAAIEAEVKDENRFPQKWAYFGFGKSTAGSPFPANSTCNACHGANGAVENTFVQFYPTLIEVARGKGTLKTGVGEVAAHR